MPLVSHADRRFLESLSALGYANPFLPERIELERKALGDQFDSASAQVWSRRSDIDRVRPNLQRLADRAEQLVNRLRMKLASGGVRATDRELELYEDLVLYVLYDRFRTDLQAQIDDSLNQPTRPKKMKLWPKFQERFDYYHHLADLTLPSRYEAAHLFAGFFQIRRAFHHIFDFIIGQSLPAARLRAAVWQSIFTHDMHRYWRTMYGRMRDFSTLVSGPSGAGKELVARAIGLSRYIPFDPRQQAFVDDFTGSFYALNLSALSPTLIESELFGHRKGSFTGAIEDRIGWLEICNPFGAVFVDEVGELDVEIQVKLLRVVQSRVFQRLGDRVDRRFEGKIIAATNRDLVREMREGRFREDLYYRLCSDLIHAPSLREQLADAPHDLESLVLFTTERIAGPGCEELAAGVTAWIDENLGRDYAWPGNMRELEQCVRNCIVRGEYRPAAAVAKASTADLRLWLDKAAAGTLTADELLSEYCASLYAQLGSYEAVARRLGLDRRTVRKKVAASEKGSPR